jgi:RNA polymerase sigma factor (sigma-70 family)
MSSVGSVTHWVEQLRAGDQAVVGPLLERYYVRLLGLARKKLQGVRLTADEGEDVALSAFHSFCQGLDRGRFPHLEDRDKLWALLVVITSRKALDLRKKQNSLRNGGGKVVGESVLDARFGEEPGAAGILQVPGGEPTPEQEAAEAEAVEGLLAMLPNDESRRIAVAKLEGRTNKEIADELSCSEATVERRLKLIRACWKKAGEA